MDMQHLPGKVRLFKCKACGEYNSIDGLRRQNNNDNNDDNDELHSLLILPNLLRDLVVFRMKAGTLPFGNGSLFWGPEEFAQINRLVDLLEHFGVNEFGDLENLFKEYM